MRTPSQDVPLMLTITRTLGSALLCFGLAHGALAAESLSGPFVGVVPKLSGSGAPACKDTPPEPVISLEVTSIYDQSEASHSTIDPEQFDEYTEGMAAPRDFLTYVTKAASDYVASDGKKALQAACVLAFLDAWARADALSDMQTRQAALSTTRLVAGLGIAFLAVRPFAERTRTDTVAIKAWFARRAKAFVRVYEDSGNRGSNRSNHRYWGGFAVAVSGVVSDDKVLLDWGVESYRIGVCQVDANGALPLELAREKKARDYHLHAIAPLVMIAELAEANGIDAYGFCAGAMHRLVKFALNSVSDPAEIEAITGAKQLNLPTSDGAMRGDRFAWVEPYFRRFGGGEHDYGFKLERPLFSSNLGGRITAYVEAKAS